MNDARAERLIIKGGTVVTAADTVAADVLIENGKIAAIAADISDPTATVIDAEHSFVLPGGVDPHTHFQSPIPTQSGDDFISGSAAAVIGGTTTVIDFSSQLPGSRILDAALASQRALTDARPYVDIGLHMIVSDVTHPNAYADLAAICDFGITSYKLFMALPPMMLDDAALLEVMSVARTTGALVMVHAENGAMIDFLVRQTHIGDRMALEWQARTRPPVTESEAVTRAIGLAQVADTPLYLVHLTLGKSLDILEEAQGAGSQVWGEICTHHLLMDESRLTGPRGELFVVAPPVRHASEHSRLWSGIRRDVVSVIASDHAAWTLQQKEEGRRAGFDSVPTGAPGVENRMPLLFHHGVRESRISINQFVALTATNPAKLFGLYPQKGTVAIGSDADIAVWNPQRRRTFGIATEQTRAGYSLYEDKTVIGAPEFVLVRGHIVVAEGELVPSCRHGEFVPRARFTSPGTTEVIDQKAWMAAGRPRSNL
jgi:dihydropyrimidinase